MRSLATLVFPALTVGAFAPATQRPAVAPLAAASWSDDETDTVDFSSSSASRMSTALPFVETPAVLQESDLAGNCGFDPLGFATDKEKLWEYREAEVKHARLAMLVRDHFQRVFSLAMSLPADPLTHMHRLPLAGPRRNCSIDRLPLTFNWIRCSTKPTAFLRC